MLTRAVLLQKVHELGPFADDANAERAVLATLSALGEQLTQDEIEWLAPELSADLASALRSWSAAGSHPALGRNEHELFQRIAAREAIWVGLATEHAQIVLGALGDTLPASVVERLARHLPELAGLFQLPTRRQASPHEPHVRAGAPHDLAEGRPGGSHPLASSDTHTLAHRHSVARSDDPHADTKLSSAQGLTQEREEHTLASGRPGANNPISSGH